MSLPLNNFRFAPDAQQPLYLSIQANLIDLMESGLLNKGDALPAERQLSEAYGVNRMTLRRAIDDLVQKGLLERRQGAGTFVVATQPVFTPTVIGFSQRMQGAGMKPASRLLDRAVIRPDLLIANRLNLPAESEVVMLKRLRLINDEPLMVETSYLSYGRFSGLINADLEHESLYRILEEDYGVRIVEAEHTLEPTLPSPFEAQHLGIDATLPAMLVQVAAYGPERSPVEISKSIVRGDRCRYFFRVNTALPITD